MKFWNGPSATLRALKDSLKNSLSGLIWGMKYLPLSGGCLWAASAQEGAGFLPVPAHGVWHYGRNKPSVNFFLNYEPYPTPLFQSPERSAQNRIRLRNAAVYGVNWAGGRLTPRIPLLNLASFEYFWINYHLGKATLWEDWSSKGPLEFNLKKPPLQPCASPKRLLLGSIYGGIGFSGICLGKVAGIPNFNLKGGLLWIPFSQMVLAFKRSQGKELDYTESIFIRDLQLCGGLSLSCLELTGRYRFPGFDSKKRLFSCPSWNVEGTAWIPELPWVALGFFTWQQRTNVEELKLTDAEVFKKKFGGLYDFYLKSFLNCFLAFRISPYVDFKVSLNWNQNFVEGATEGATQKEFSNTPGWFKEDFKVGFSCNFRLSQSSAGFLARTRVGAYQSFYARSLTSITPLLVPATAICLD